jgi:hypothetical protein
LFVVGEDDLYGRARKTEPSDVPQGINFRLDYCAEKAAPRQNDRNAGRNCGDFRGQDIQWLGNTK